LIIELSIIAELLRDISCKGLLTPRQLKLTTARLSSRVEREGLSFLTKTLPRIGKALDRALSSEDPFALPGFQKKPGTSLPLFMGELFEQIFDSTGKVLPDPRVECIAVLRSFCYLFYKYKLPFEQHSSTELVDQFKETDRLLAFIDWTRPNPDIIRIAGSLLSDLFKGFDPLDIYPRHGPGAVAEKLKHGAKFDWLYMPQRLLSVYDLSYFTTGPNHLFDQIGKFANLVDKEPAARVILVPKDSRGPRIISSEPAVFQWIQQGLMRRIVTHVERHPLTKGQVWFTEQQHNQTAALAASRDGQLCTLDLKEASDRVSTELVERIFPAHMLVCLKACRSVQTTLPSGEVIQLNKFAPMGSALCFPVMALTIWALITASRTARQRSDTLLVYGDDVIVPTAQAGETMAVLESVGLMVNRSKSCTQGLFRESCGMDAYKGVSVSPQRIRTLWSSTPAASHYTSWIAYANSLWHSDYCHTSLFIAKELHRIYPMIPHEDTCEYPALRIPVTETYPTPRTRVNSNLQRLERRVPTVEPIKCDNLSSGWDHLLRYFTEACNLDQASSPSDVWNRWSFSLPSNPFEEEESKFQASVYTVRRRSKLRLRWR
jgi:hypothetical protein